MFCLHVCPCTVYMQCTQRLKRASDTLELQLEIVVGHHRVLETISTCQFSLLWSHFSIFFLFFLKVGNRCSERCTIVSSAPACEPAKQGRTTEGSRSQPRFLGTVSVTLGFSHRRVLESPRQCGRAGRIKQICYFCSSLNSAQKQ